MSLSASQRSSYLVIVMKLLQRSADPGVLLCATGEAARWLFSAPTRRGTLPYGLSQREKWGLLTALTLFQVPPLGSSATLAPQHAARQAQLGDLYFTLQRAQTGKKGGKIAGLHCNIYAAGATGHSVRGGTCRCTCPGGAAVSSSCIARAAAATMPMTC